MQITKRHFYCIFLPVIKIGIYAQELSKNCLAQFTEEQILFSDQYCGVDCWTGYWHIDIAMGAG
jgi:hypothetical protein